MTQERLKNMIESCYTYGGAEKTDYNYQRYILPYKDSLGEEVFNAVYNEHIAFLKENATIDHSVYTDSEGCSYNSLKFK